MNRKILREPTNLNFQLERVLKEKVMHLAAQRGMPVSIFMRLVVESAINNCENPDFLNPVGAGASSKTL